MATISERVIKGVKYRFPLDVITEHTRFSEDLNIDSLGMMELVMDLEDEFGVNIPTNKIDSAATVEDVVRMFANWNDGVIDNAE
jgi:acyl carrier protein